MLEEIVKQIPQQWEEKLDGSYIKVFFHDGWHICTRSTFGQGKINWSGVTWAEVVRRHLNLDGLDKTITYIFELVGPLNRIIRVYEEGLYLIAGRQNGYELSDRTLDNLSCQMGVNRPQTYQVSREDLKDWMAKLELADPTHEGVILKDSQFNRYKFKSKTWYASANIWANGNVATPRSFVEFYIRGEDAELMAMFPQYAEIFTVYKNALDSLVALAKQAAHEYKELGQKEFADKVVGTPYAPLAFAARKGKDMFDVNYLVKYLKGL